MQNINDIPIKSECSKEKKAIYFIMLQKDVLT